MSFFVIFVVYMFLLHSAHELHISKTSFSPICQPVATESARAIQILKELQVTFILHSHSQAGILPDDVVGTNAANIRVSKLRFL